MPDEVEFTDYALFRMHQRDVLEEEVLQALFAPSSKHRHRTDGRSEVRERIGQRTLLVVYEGRGSVTVINAMWE